MRVFRIFLSNAPEFICETKINFSRHTSVSGIDSEKVKTVTVAKSTYLLGKEIDFIFYYKEGRCVMRKYTLHFYYCVFIYWISLEMPPNIFLSRYPLLRSGVENKEFASESRRSRCRTMHLPIGVVRTLSSLPRKSRGAFRYLRKSFLWPLPKAKALEIMRQQFVWACGRTVSLVALVSDGRWTPREMDPSPHVSRR